MGLGSYQSGTGGQSQQGNNGSNFLTGAGAAAGSAWGPVGYGVGAAAGNLAGQVLTGKGVNFRGKYARNKLAHDKKIWAAQQKHHLSTIRPNQAELMKSMDDSGLHRLAALGITPGQGQTSSSNQPMIPGQHPDFGSAIGTGINTALQISQADRSGALAIEEQGLRNDWLKSQIARSNMALLKESANNNVGAGSDRVLENRDGDPLQVGKGSSAEQFEKWIAEWANVMPTIVGRAWDMFKQDARQSMGIKGDSWQQLQKIVDRNKRSQGEWKPDWSNKTRPHESIRYR